MLLEGQDLAAGDGVPDFAGPVVAACNELVARLIEGAICQRQQMRSQDLKETKLLLLVLHLLLDQF